MPLIYDCQAKRDIAEQVFDIGKVKIKIGKEIVRRREEVDPEGERLEEMTVEDLDVLDDLISDLDDE